MDFSVQKFQLWIVVYIQGEPKNANSSKQIPNDIIYFAYLGFCTVEFFVGSVIT